MEKLLDNAVKTITDILEGKLPQVQRALQEGHGGWWYNLNPFGGSTPPGKKPAIAIRLLWPKPELPKLAPENVEALLKLKGVMPFGTFQAKGKRKGYLLFVATEKGFVHWFMRGSNLRVSSRWKLAGDVPLIFADGKTPVDSLRVQVGIALYRQGWNNEEFVKKLQGWVEKKLPRGSKEKTGEITARLLKGYTPINCSPVSYIKKCAGSGVLLSEIKNVDGSSQLIENIPKVEQVAQKLGISKQTLYNRMTKLGLFEEVRIEKPGIGVAVVSTKKRFGLTPEIIKLLEEDNEERNIRKSLIQLVKEKRGVGTRAAERWVKRRLDSGKTPREIMEEVIGLRKFEKILRK